jgi:hypothetical protein
MQTPFEQLATDAKITFRGAPVLISEQMPDFNMRFVI